VLERWREFGDDGSIKWLLVTFLADCPAKGAATYHLRPGSNPAPKTPAKPTEGLGPLRLSLTDADGKTFTGADLKDVKTEVVETGPVRACVMLEAPSAAPFGYIAWVYTYAGLERADLIVVLKNTPRTTSGPFYFDDFSVAVEADGEAYSLGGGPGDTYSGRTDAGAVYLYQAGDGTENWQKLGQEYRDAMILGWGEAKQTILANLPPFRGYQVKTGGEKAGEGDSALGWVALGNGKRTTVLATRWFLQDYPSAVEVQPGKVISRPFPKYWDQYGGLHWLDDMQRKRFDISMQIVDGAFTGATGDRIALAWNRPLVAHCGYGWYGKTGAVGNPNKPGGKPDYKAGVFPVRFTPGNSWRSFGGDVTDSIKRRYHSTRMRGFLASADPWGAYRLLADMEHSCGMNCFHVDDYQYPRDKDMLNYGQYCGTFRSAGKYHPGTAHHGFFPWNVPHFQVWEVFHGWRLFGDPLAKRTIDEFAQYLRGYVAWRQEHPGHLVAGTRADGHPFTNLVEGYRVLGREDLLESMHDMAEVSWKQINKQRGNYGVMASWEGGKDRCEKPFMMAQVMEGLREYWDITHSERTADQIYGMADFILTESAIGQWGYKYVVMIDPEANKKHLADSLAQAEKDGKHLSYGNLAWAMAWTTPVDTARIQVKYAGKPMVERAWPDKVETHDNWWSATHVANEPEPKPGAQTMVVEGVPAGRRVFAIRGFDAASNRSGLSNMVAVDVK